MGVLRLLLAMAVVLSHMGYSLYGYNPGVMAVVVFYLLAGQVVAKLWFKAPTAHRFWWFVRDRALRVLPAYYVSLALVAVLWWLGLVQDPYFLAHDPTAFDWWANLSLLPMNYFMFNGSDRFALLPTAWSLAVEVQFYVLVPLLLSCRGCFRLVAVLSLLVFLAAQVGFLPHEDYGYRLLPGVLWVFLSGALLAQGRREAYVLLGVLWFLCGVYATYLFSLKLTTPYLFEVTFGYNLGLLLLLFLGRLRAPSLHWPWLQRLAGAYSYPLFLIHLPVIWWVNTVFDASSWALVWVLMLSMIYAMLVHHWVERRLWHYLRPMLNL